MVSATTIAFEGQGGDSLEAFFAVPEEAVRDGAAVLLVHEVYGLDAHMRELARRFAAEGYPTLVPDLYGREGLPGPASTEADPAPAWELETIRAAVAGLPDRRSLADLDAALAWLGKQDDVDPRSIAVVGFCMGGTLAFLSGCTSTRVGAVVDFYGGPLYRELSANKPTQPIELHLNLDRPFLGLFGGEDAHIPAEHVELLRERLSMAGKDHEIVVYPGAGHGFFNDARAHFAPDAAADAWRRVLAFLGENL